MEEYLGYKTVSLSGKELSYVFSSSPDNIFGLCQNEYLIVKDGEGNVVNLMKCVGDKIKPITSWQIKTDFTGDVKARNVEQKLAIDMLMDGNTTIKTLKGKAGGGKDFLIAAAAMQMLDKGKYKKIVFVRNNIDVRGSKPIGHLPGSQDDKLMPFVMPFADKVGGIEVVRDMIANQTFEIAPFSFIRGRSFDESIVICCEAENMTKDNIKLLVSRIGEGSVLFINGDTDQIDLDMFVKDNGLIAATNSLKGNKLFSCVTLTKTERSATAALADLIQ